MQIAGDLVVDTLTHSSMAESLGHILAGLQQQMSRCRVVAVSSYNCEARGPSMLSASHSARVVPTRPASDLKVRPVFEVVEVVDSILVSGHFGLLRRLF